MTRLEKKCLVASAGAHAALMLSLCLAPLLLVSHKEEVILPVLTLIPSRLTDGPTTGGGSPTSKSTAPLAPAAGPVVQPQLFVAPPAPKAEPLPPKPEPPAPKPEKRVAQTEPEPAPKPRTRKTAEPVVTDKPVPKEDEGEDSADAKPSKRKPIVPTFKRETSREPGESESRTRRAELRAAQERYAALVKSIVGAIGQGVSQGTAIDLPGPGGEATANYKSFVEMVYRTAWFPPPDLTDEQATVRAKVVIRRDGSVESFEIVKSSRHGDLDKSVERLKRIPSIGARFPEGATESTRTYYINFNLQAKRDNE